MDEPDHATAGGFARGIHYAQELTCQFRDTQQESCAGHLVTMIIVVVLSTYI